MPCGCKAGKCTGCACAKAGVLCTAACHGGTDNCQCLNFAEGVQAKKLAVGMIRKTLAGAGLNVMGSKDELVRRLADHLRQLNHDNSGDAAGGGDGAAAPAPAPAAGGGARLVASVLAASGRGEDSAAILSLAGAVISAASTTAEMRKAYRRLSVKVHPDKNGNSSDSKAAFQVVVSAFEELSRPPAEPDGDDGQKKKQKPRPKPTRIVRGNGGCHKTRVFCPRCHMLWGKAELGLEEGAYNFMMMGLKEYVCGRCACEFGCMSASHRCPHCNKGVEYHPQDYHRQVLCGNSSCTKTFGFWQFKVGERRELQVRKEVKLATEERLKRREGQARRAARMAKRHGGAGGSGGGDGGGRSQEEQLFVAGLLDACPRCGRTPDAPTIEAAAAHLARCTDAEAIAAHTAKRHAQEDRKHAMLVKQRVQEDAMAVAQWEFNGRQVGQLWMLSEASLAAQCEIYGVIVAAGGGSGSGSSSSTTAAASAPPASNKPLLIAALAKALRAVDRGRLLTNGADDAAAAAAAQVDTAGIEDVTDEELPTNLWGMEQTQLQAVCASYGLPFEARDSKSELIAIIERARYKHEPQMLLLEGGQQRAGAMLLEDDGQKGVASSRGGGSSGTVRGGKRKRARRADDGAGSSAEEDADYEPGGASPPPAPAARQRKRPSKNSKNPPAGTSHGRPAPVAAAAAAAAAATSASQPPPPAVGHLQPTGGGAFAAAAEQEGGPRVRGIVRKRVVGTTGVTQFKIRFKGAGPEGDQWWDEGDSRLAPKHVAAFKRKLAAKLASSQS